MPFIGGWPEGEAMKPADAVGAFAMFTVLGALAGKGLSVINPWKGSEWMAFP